MITDESYKDSLWEGHVVTDSFNVSLVDIMHKSVLGVVNIHIYIEVYPQFTGLSSQSLISVNYRDVGSSKVVD